MRVIFQSEGGIAHFPGLSRPVTIDGDQLPEPAAAELRQLIEAARLFDQPAQVGARRPAPPTTGNTRSRSRPTADAIPCA